MEEAKFVLEEAKFASEFAGKYNQEEDDGSSKQELEERCKWMSNVSYKINKNG